MRFLDELRAEHTLIDSVLGAFRSWVELGGDGDPADGPRFLKFFRLWAGDHHHAREEQVLFPAIVQRLSLPADRGPIRVLTGDHERLGALLARMGSDLVALRPLAVEYSRGLWLHIDAENSVLLPEAEQRLVRAGVHELPDRTPSVEEVAARDDGARLAEKYPQFEDLAIIRGEGCVICPAYGVGCDGVEKEWWNQHEWDELPHRVG